MAQSPSQRRHEGREDYVKGASRDDCPYTLISSFAEDWLEGWDMEAKWAAARVEEENDRSDHWRLLSMDCPWKDNTICEANNRTCEESNCAPTYWAEEIK